jgi:predicted ATPase
MDRLTSVRIAGFRAIADLELPLNGLTVLVGDNGTGKSTVIQALELLSRAGHSSQFVRDLLSFHGRPLDLLRFGAPPVLSLSLRIESDDANLSYSFGIAADPTKTWASVHEERLDFIERSGPPPAQPLRPLERVGNTGKVFDPPQNKTVESQLNAEQLALSFFGGAAHPAIWRVQRMLQGIRVHVPFDTTPAWIAEEQKRQPGMRAPVTFEPATRLSRLGTNLPNAFSALKNREPAAWQAVLDDVRAGLGPEVADVQVHPVGRGVGDIAIQFHGLSAPVFSPGLSDGQLSYLGFVALRHLDDAASLVAFDEPETHLHPALLARVVWLFEELAKDRPVVLSTHSDALLNMLSNPAEQVRVCRLDDKREMKIDRLDPAKFERFRKEFGGIGDLRREGLLSSLVTTERAP